MACSRAVTHKQFIRILHLQNSIQIVPIRMKMRWRRGISLPSGALLPEPKKVPFGLLGIICVVVPGLFIGAAISKYMANFLEENELFVPSDDDDDDD